MDIDAILGNNSFSVEEQQYRDLYAILNCSTDATPEQITTEYKALAMQYHPDKQKLADVNATANFNNICKAYSILSDKRQRDEYDRWRMSGLRISFPRWRSLDQHAQTVHWQSAKPQPSIAFGTSGTPTQANSNNPVSIPTTQWERSESPVGSNLARFRNNEF